MPPLVTYSLGGETLSDFMPLHLSISSLFIISLGSFSERQQSYLLYSLGRKNVHGPRVNTETQKLISLGILESPHITEMWDFKHFHFLLNISPSGRGLLTHTFAIFATHTPVQSIQVPEVLRSPLVADEYLYACPNNLVSF